MEASIITSGWFWVIVVFGAAAAFLAVFILAACKQAARYDEWMERQQAGGGDPVPPKAEADHGK